MGRPTKYSPERCDVILQAIREGNTHKTAVALSGVDFSTYENWVARYSDFAADVKRADAEAEQASVTVIRQAASTTWQAAAWWLERRRHEDWGKKIPDNLTVNNYSGLDTLRTHGK